MVTHIRAIRLPVLLHWRCSASSARVVLSKMSSEQEGSWGAFYTRSLTAIQTSAMYEGKASFGV